MTESDINISTFSTNIFRQFCYISFLNYLVQKKKKQSMRAGGKPWRRFLNTEGLRFTGCDKPAPPVIKFKFYFETKTPIF